MFSCDHAGYKANKDLIKYVRRVLEEQMSARKWMIQDYGCEEHCTVDYPDMAHHVCKNMYVEKVKLWEGIDEREVKEHRICGVLLCGSGQGMSITANKHPNVRAALCWDEEIARQARGHGDANVLCLPARYTGKRKMRSIVRAFISTPFEGGRHKRRINKINFYENT